MNVLCFKKLHDDAVIPEFKSKLAAGLDLSSVEDAIIAPGCRKVIKTGLAMQMPENWECQIRSRSGLAAKHGINVLNSPGTVDADYRGELMVTLQNSSHVHFEIKKGDRIAQLVPNELPRPIYIQEVDELTETERGAGGIGSTGIRP